MKPRLSVLRASFIRTLHSPPKPSTNRHSSTTPPSSRWLINTKSRIGKCIMFGLPPPLTTLAARALRILSTEWRSLISGHEGFLSAPKYAGLLRHKVVWGEMDSMGHVNNVAYVRYAESARVQWAENYALRGRDGEMGREEREGWRDLASPRGVGMILRSIGVDYKFPMKYPDHITVLHKLASLPKPTDDSFTLDVMIISELHQRPSSRCIEDIVVYDYKKGRKTQMPEWMMSAFEKTWAEQEAEGQRVRERIQLVEDLVGALEDKTWKARDAVEDMGSHP
ncbi:thioesterase-like superfamily-domain-containing protein [Bisporella sp. PMI_857]|nr:thioesterase-like superfamily-domain-containing protein [Bisporella sp. PMI_857]